jgi:hypothetical protein
MYFSSKRLNPPSFLPAPLKIYSITRDFGEDSDGTKSVESESASEEESSNDKDSSTGTFFIHFSVPYVKFSSYCHDILNLSFCLVTD